MMIWQPSTGIWVPPPIGPIPIPPSPPAERRKKREDEIRRQIVPVRCPGIAPAAWREVQQMMPGILNSAVLGANALAITAPTAFWRMDDVNDSVGSLNWTNSSPNPVTFGAGKIGNCGAFVAASSEFLQQNNNASFTGGTGVSISMWAWVFINQTGNLYPILAQYDTTSRFYLRFSDTDVRFNAFDGTSSRTAILSHTASTGVWYFVVGGFNAAKAAIDATVSLGLSVDGAAVTYPALAAPGITKINDTGAPHLWMGQTTSSVFMDGQIDAVAWFHNYFPTDAEVALGFNGGAGTEYYSGIWHP